MNMHTTEIDREPTRDEAERALRLLRRWAAQADEAERAALDPAVERLVPGRPPAAYPDLARDYPADFTVDAAYRATLPDLQNGPASLIRGARRAIQHVGISNFRLPMRWAARDGGEHVLETSVTGTVGLAADHKGINMSRILRSFYAVAGEAEAVSAADAALDAYKRDLDSPEARLCLRVSYPIEVDSLRSGLTGWQYYDLALEVAEADGVRRHMLHLDYVYSSTCPCSLELSEHARRVRGQLATPHSQRSVARLSVALDPGAPQLWVEDLVDLAREGVPTETQVMVKREDEQAFAELNAANAIFVEDAVRSFCAALRKDARIGDFRVVASHQESLHSHDAVSVLTEGETFAQDSLDPALFSTLIHRG